MTIKTQFGLNEIIFYLHEGKITRSRVDIIETVTVYSGLTTPSPVNIIYIVMNHEGERIELNEREVYNTAQMLCDFLKQNIFDLSNCNYPTL